MHQNLELKLSARISQADLPLKGVVETQRVLYLALFDVELNMQSNPTCLTSDYNWRSSFKSQYALENPSASDRRRRGYEFEHILRGMFDEDGLKPQVNFRPKGEELDGSIWFQGHTILIEAKWTANPHPASSLYQFKGKVDGKLRNTLGLFISMQGFSRDSIDALLTGKELNLILMDGQDMQFLASDQSKLAPEKRMTIQQALELKIRKAAELGTPLFPLAQQENGSEVVLVEGTADRIILSTLQKLFVVDRPVSITSAGGPRNMPPLINGMLDSDVKKLTVVLEDDKEISPSVVKDIIHAASEFGNRIGRIDNINSVIFTRPLEEAFNLVRPGEKARDARMRLWLTKEKDNNNVYKSVEGASYKLIKTEQELLRAAGIRFPLVRIS